MFKYRLLIMMVVFMSYHSLLLAGLTIDTSKDDKSKKMDVSNKTSHSSQTIINITPPPTLQVEPIVHPTQEQSKLVADGGFDIVKYAHDGTIAWIFFIIISTLGWVLFLIQIVVSRKDRREHSEKVEELMHIALNKFNTKKK